MKLRLTSWKLFKGLAAALACLIIAIAAHVILKEMIYLSRDRAVNHPAQDITVPGLFEPRIYFNNIVGGSGAIEQIKRSIDKARHSVEVAIFSMNSERLKKSLYAAHERGVKVTIIFNRSTGFQHDKAFADLPRGITRIDAGTHDKKNSKNTTYMHHKFMIVDRGHPSQELTTGSFDFTDISEKYVQSFFMTTSDPTLIAIYAHEFNLLKKGVMGVAKLAKRSYEPWAARIGYQNGFVEVWMSPGFSKNSVKYRILQLIDSARTRVDVMMWNFNDRQIARALVKKSEEGVKVRIVVEDTFAKHSYSAMPFLAAQKKKKNLSNLEIVLDTKSAASVTTKVPRGFNPYLHQHAMIVDGQTAVFGTSNWGRWGFYRNDEDMIVTNNGYLVSEFQKTFDFFYQLLQ